MFSDDQGPADAATGITDEFVDAGVAKLDGVFGQGYAKDNPQALAAYIAASASNLNAFMTAASSIPDNFELDDLAAAFEEAEPEPPAPHQNRKRR